MVIEVVEDVESLTTMASMMSVSSNPTSSAIAKQCSITVFTAKDLSVGVAWVGDNIWLVGWLLRRNKQWQCEGAGKLVVEPCSSATSDGLGETILSLL